MHSPLLRSSSLLAFALAALPLVAALGGCPAPATGGEGEGEGAAGEGEGAAAGEGEGAAGEGEGAAAGEGEGAAGEGEGAAAGEGEGAAAGEGEGAAAGEGEGEGGGVEPAECLTPITAVLGDNTGDTTGGAVDLQGEVGCLDDDTQPERVYAFTPTQSGELVVTLTPTGTSDLGLYARSDCGNSATNLTDAADQTARTCVDGEGAPPDPAETATFELGPDPIFIVVDTFAVPGAYTLNLAFAASTCGDGSVTGAEQCEGANVGAAQCKDALPATDGTLTCDAATCAFVTTSCTAVCPSATVAVAGANSGDTTNGTNGLDASCETDSGAEHIFLFTPTATGVMTLDLASDTDQGVSVRDTCANARSERACSDDNSGGIDEHLAASVTAGVAVTIVVQAFNAGDEGPFTLTIANTAVTGVTEVEPNDTPPGTVNAFATGFTGFIADDADVDCVSVHATAGQSITATVGDGGDGRCAATAIDSFVTIFDVDGTTDVGDNDDIDNANGNLCSSATTDNPVAADGTYFVCVQGSPIPQPGADVFEYTLDVAVGN